MAEQEEYKAGRPFVFTDPEELKTQIDLYFKLCDPHVSERLQKTGRDEKNRPIFEMVEELTKQIQYSITELALHLGVSRKTILNYRNPEHYSEAIEPEIRQQLIHTIESAVQKIEAFNERALFTGNAMGVKFNLVNNFGWEDKKVNENQNTNIPGVLDELDDIADNATEKLEGPDEGSETPE